MIIHIVAIIKSIYQTAQGIILQSLKSKGWLKNCLDIKWQLSITDERTNYSYRKAFFFKDCMPFSVKFKHVKVNKVLIFWNRNTNIGPQGFH